MNRDADYGGMNWIRKEKRLAIYLRDGLSCVYCGFSIEDEGVILTLDHLVPQCKRGTTNNESNLVTCCARCNSVRGTRPWKKFCEYVAAYINHGIKAEQIIHAIQASVKRTVDVKSAKTIMELRSWPEAMQYAAKKGGH